MLPKISVIIPVRNDAEVLRRCLESLRKVDYPKDSLEIIVVDGLSNDNSRAIAVSYGATVITNDKKIVAPARNIGYAAATGELVAYIDADCVVDSGWLAKSVKYFDDPRVGGVSGPTLASPDSTLFEKAVEVIFNLSESFGVTAHRRRIREIVQTDDLPGCNAIYRKSALDKVMPIDEHFVAADDSWISFRVRGAGYVLWFTPDVILWHYHHNPPRKFFYRMYRYGISRLQAGKKDWRLLNVFYILFGFSIPIFLGAALISYMTGLSSLFLFLTAASLVFIFLVGLAKTRSIIIALDLLWASVLFSSGWSIGFLRELLFPLGMPKGGERNG